MLELKIEITDDSKKSSIDRLNLLKKTFETITDLTEETDINITQDGLSIQAMDNMQIMYADIFLSKNIFSSYRCDRNLVLGLKTKVFLNVLKGIRLENFKYFLMSCEDNAEILNITVENTDCTISKKLTLFSFDKEAFNIPDLEYDVSVKMPMEFFLFLQKSITESGEFLQFCASKDNLTLKVKGEMVSSKIEVRTTGENAQAELQCLASAEKVLPIKFINSIAKSAQLGESVDIKFSSETPVFFGVTMGEMGRVKYYVAPKEVEEDEE